MKLRSMNAAVESKQPEKIRVRSSEGDKYIRELQGLFNELPKLKGCPTERISAIIDIFTYVDENLEKVKNDDCLKGLHDSVRDKAKVTMYDIALGSSSADSVILEKLKQLALLCVSIIAKLG